VDINKAVAAATAAESHLSETAEGVEEVRELRLAVAEKGESKANRFPGCKTVVPFGRLDYEGVRRFASGG